MRKRSGSGLFLMEMIVVVFFFILCASTCILVFVRSNNLSSLAKDTNQSVIVAESIAEFFKVGNLEQCKEVMQAEEKEDGSYTVMLNREWDYISDGNDCAYRADVFIGKDDGMENAKIQVTRISDSKVLYELDVCSYRG